MPREAQAELARRELARRRLANFGEYVHRWYHAAAHHRMIAEYLEQVETYIRTKGRTGIGRLMIFAPPRHGKSEMVSRLFPAWVLGRNPDMRVILTSYNAELATGHNRAVRDLVLGEQFGALFGGLASVDAPVVMSDDNRSVRTWYLAEPHRGGVTAAGVGGGLTGKGAHLLVIDDPFRNREDAESEPLREKTDDWYKSTAYTRLEDGGAIVLMHTRWHQDDQAGRLLKRMALAPRADQWRILMLPAIANPHPQPLSLRGEGSKTDREWLAEGLCPPEPDALGRQAGEALWPQKYSTVDLEQTRANIGEYEFAALYQQEPFLRSGNFFLQEWLPVVDQGPKAEAIRMRVRCWDKAASAAGDFTAGVLIAITEDEMYYVEHVAYGKWTPGERDQMMVETGKGDRERPGPLAETWHQQDPGSAGVDSAQATNQAFAKAGLRARFKPVSGDKTVRAGPWSSMCQAGRVRVVRGAWNAEFIQQHLAFPHGKYDDLVDAAASAFAQLADGGPLILFGA
jgi:predicted phage terminase large subunit-like protein